MANSKHLMTIVHVLGGEASTSAIRQSLGTFCNLRESESLVS